MRITDPLWPAVREISRRVLKASKVNFIFPSEFENQIHEFDLAVQEHIPSRIDSSLFTISTTQNWSIQTMQGSIIASPRDSSDFSYVYVPMNCHDFLIQFFDCCRELLQAGYPGCEDCIQDVGGTYWNEENNRKELNQSLP